jgi:hypothetical protein
MTRPSKPAAGQRWSSISVRLGRCWPDVPEREVEMENLHGPGDVLTRPTHSGRPSMPFCLAQH